MKNILVVIPARGGSKGIPRKNIRHFCGSPLISKSIFLARNYNCIVTSDDPEILTISSKLGANTHKRPQHLATDECTLESVILDVVKSTNKTDWDAVVTIQPTSPLLKVNTLENALVKFFEGDYDTLLSVENDTHLRWGIDKNNNPYQLYNERLNRQYLPKEYKETGALVICKPEFLLKNKTRFSNNIGLFEIDKKEAVDIDDYTDWAIAEVLENQNKKALFITKGNMLIGTGHIYNCLSLANILGGYNCEFWLPKTTPSSIKEIILKRNFTLNLFDENTFEELNFQNVSLTIVDFLDFPVKLIETIKKKTKSKIISFENISESSSLCDITFNAIYKDKKNNESKNIYYGPNYFILRDEFLLTEKYSFNENIKTILIAYGGTDPSDLTIKTLSEIYNYCNDNFIKIIVILGKPYQKRKIIEREFPDVIVKQDLFSISGIMSISDLAFTSSGRTVFELSHLNVPCIITSQNPREETHFFSDYDYHKYLGLSSEITSGSFLSSLKQLCDLPKVRHEIHIKLKDFNFKKNIKTIINKIKQHE